METQNRWGLVFLVGGFLILAAFVALGTFYFESGRATNEKTPRTGVSSDTLPIGSSWQTVLEEILANDASAPFVTEAVALELSSKFDEIFANESVSESEKEEALSEVLKSTVKKPETSPTHSLQELSIRNDVAVAVYRELLILVLRESSKVREYELVVFSRAVKEGKYAGVPELKESATLYRKIENALIATPVPPSLAREHLDVVNGVGALANIVGAMGRWSGDPILGLTYLDGFIEAENSLAARIETLFTAIEKAS